MVIFLSFPYFPYCITQAIPSRLSSRKKFSTASKSGGASAPGPAGKPPESQGSLPTIVIGSFAVGAAFCSRQSHSRKCVQEAQDRLSMCPVPRARPCAWRLQQTSPSRSQRPDHECALASSIAISIRLSPSLSTTCTHLPYGQARSGGLGGS